MNNHIASDGTVLTDDEAVKPPTFTLMELVDAYRHVLIKGNIDYTPTRAQEIYDNIQAYANEYDALKYCYSPDKVFTVTCACGKKDLYKEGYGDGYREDK